MLSVLISTIARWISLLTVKEVLTDSFGDQVLAIPKE
jgi:hypothetical protein